ncbi:UDP-glycosyltransferase 86A2 [Cucurbita pepo subsp. pepo]|uniref:UDP-glycosyltransferase 86A2 n=1 Tax=Cucurbita pepo subsp. pepo TaxID=3664 RepID=UPI000C9D57BD|nr:UDP-glycosyltransferase 86A2 [Cucurbita pepo subsp. pepo]
MDKENCRAKDNNVECREWDNRLKTRQGNTKSNLKMALQSDHHNQNPHAIFIPYPLQGHVIPSVHLATHLAARGFTLTFINTHAIHHQTSTAHSTPLDDLFSGVRNSGLDIRYTTVSDGLPLGFDRSLNHDQFMGSLLHVFSAHVEEEVEKIVKTASSGGAAPVSCLIADTFFVWPSKVAKKLNLLYVSFWTEPALVFSLYYHLNLLRKNRHFECQDVRQDAIDYIPGVSPINPQDTMSYLQETDTTSVCHQIIFAAFHDVKAADFVLCNTVQELENDTVSALQAQIPFYAIGPIFPRGFTKSSVATSLWPESDCTHWLNTKPHGSVLYVSFGSYAHVSKTDLTEIAYGLSLSGVHFIWVIRPDIVSSNDTDPLPVGYRKEVGERSMIVTWCRQNQVLAHPAIGGFLSHCGWNSILESIWCNVPLLCFPLLTDQFTNRKLVVEDWTVGINLRDGRQMISKEKVSEKINRLMDLKSGSQYRTAVREVRKTLEDAVKPNGTSDKAMNRFINDLNAAVSNKCERRNTRARGF